MINVRSPVFKNGENVPKKYTCDGEGINPPLTISDLPPETKSLVLIVDDPDAPSGTFTHWALWNIPTDTQEIGENDIPAGATGGINSAGKNTYTSPCPPSGTHRYFFKVYALDTIINLPTNTKVSELSQTIEDHILDEGVLMGKYSRQ